MRKIAVLVLIAVMATFSSCGKQTAGNVQPLPVTSEEITDKNEAVAEKLPLEGKIICVDAGHGINDSNMQEPIAPGSSETKRAFVSGTRGKNLTEEELNLAVALKLEKALNELGAQVHLTRNTHKTELSNVGRAEFANDLGADVSVKIHADGNDNSALHGVSMLVPSNTSIQDEYVYSQSRKAGELVLQAVVKSTQAVDRGVVERSDMTGFNWSKVPVILLEMGFMTNPEEDARMETDEYQDKIVSGIVNGLTEYFK